MRCPVCRADKIQFLFPARDVLYRMVEDTFRIQKCLNCKALFLDPFPTQKETEKFYPTTYYSYDTAENGGFFENLKKKIIKSKMEVGAGMNFFDTLLVKIFQGKFSGVPLYRKEGGRFLDIGCGSGKNLKLLEGYGWETYGIELDEAAVRHAQDDGLRVEQSSLETAQFVGKRFDSIRIWHVFEHLTDPQAAMKKLKDLLEREGEILMALPNAESWACKIFGRYWYGLDVPRHVISYSPKTLTMLLARNDMRIEEMTYASCGSFVGSFSNFLRSRFGYRGNLINNLFLVFLFSPLDFLSDFFKRGDTLFLKIRKNG